MPVLLAMSAAMHAESPTFRRFRYSEEKMFGVISRLIPVTAQGGVLVSLDGDVVTGMLGFAVSEQFFSPDKVSMDVGIYVKPEHRGTPAFMRLVRAYEAEAHARGVSDITLGVSTGVHAERTVDALHRLGYETYGTNLRKVSK